MIVFNISMVFTGWIKIENYINLIFMSNAAKIVDRLYPNYYLYSRKKCETV